MKKAQRWDKAYAHKSDAFSSTDRWKREAEEIISKVFSQTVVLDFACNTGRFFEILRRQSLQITRMVGVDINEEAIVIARRHLDDPSAEFYTSLDDVISCSVDFVACMHALPQLQFPEHELAQIWRVLKRGGRISIITNNKWNDWLHWPINWFTGYKHDQTRFGNYSKNEVKELMKLAGFVQDEIRVFGGGWVCRLLPFCKPRIVYHGHKAGAV